MASLTSSDPERTIEFEFVRATENAALNVLPWLGRGEIPYLFQIAPNPHVIYEDKLPDGVRTLSSSTVKSVCLRSLIGWPVAHSLSPRIHAAFARQTGNELVEQATNADEFIHLLRRR